MIINHNMNALNAHRMMTGNTATAGKSMEKLSSGLRINRAGDDAAGLAISEKMRAQIRGLDQASRNANDGISMIQTAEGALNETHSILQRMRELATQASNDTNVEVDRDAIQTEMNQLTSEINRIGNSTEFNTQKLLDGGATASTTAVGSNEASGQAARAAVVQSTNVDAVFDNSFALATGDAQIVIGGTSGVAFSFKAGEKNADLLLDYSNGNAVTNDNGADFTDLGGTAEGLELALENMTDQSGLIKLSDLADVSVSETGEITITSKAVGQDASIVFTKAGVPTQDAAAAVLEDLGLATTITTNEAFVGAEGTAAVITGNEIDTAATYGTDSDQINADTAQGKKFQVDINGTTYTVTLDAEAIDAGGAGLNSGAADETKFLATLNDALERAKDINGDTVDISGEVAFTASADHEITLTMDSSAIPDDGSVPELKLSGDYASTILNGIEDGQNSSGGTFKATLQIGANEGQSFEVAIDDMRGKALGVSGDISGASAGTDGAAFTKTASVTNGTSSTNSEYALDLSDHDKATNAINVINDAINTVSTQRATLGAAQNRLEHTINNLGTSSENLTSAESRVRDVDMAKEMMTFSKNNILSQAAQAMLAQANQQPQGVLQLLR